MLVLLNGLVPSFAEALEFVTHYASTGHVAHVEPGERDLPDLGDEEHGCGPTSHHCGCCVNIPVDLVQPAGSLPAPRAVTLRVDLPDDAPEAGISSRLYRPPIA